jgi:micrococcal nuclease
MRHHMISMILLLVLILIPASAWAWQGKVIGIPACDTVTVLHDGRAEEIKLYGIACPEHVQDFSHQAIEFTWKVAIGEDVEIIPISVDPKGLTIGILSIGNKTLNQELIRAGLVWISRSRCKESFCSQWKQVQDDARKTRVGLWAIVDSVPTTPSGQEKKISEKEQPSHSASKKKSKKANYLHGDTVTHIFHAPGCEKYNCRNCIVPFKTRDQAIRAGYRPCELCNP